MYPAQKSSGFRPIIILSYFLGYEPHVVAAIYGEHNISIFLSFYDHPPIPAPSSIS